jgi:hypothetical protein
MPFFAAFFLNLSFRSLVSNLLDQAGSANEQQKFSACSTLPTAH